MTANGQQIARYSLELPVARGGMGEIWKGRDTRSGRQVAIKRLWLDTDSHAGTTCRVRLQREAEALGRLRHENIVQYLDSGVDAEGHPYLVLEWLEGEDLAQRQHRARLDLPAVVEVARQALAGLEYCHAQGVVHRDLKPANLFLVGAGDGELQVKLVDFGLALLGDDVTRLTRAGQVLGTLHYLSPEQARGAQDIDHRADLYTLGVILYELTTGTRPFDSEQPVAVLLKIVTDTPPRPRQIRPDLPGWLEELILRAMQRAPSARFASAAAMLEALPSAAQVGLVPAPVAAPSPVLATTLPPLSTASVEHRLVSILCAQPMVPGQDLSPAISRASEDQGGVCQGLLGGQFVALFGLESTVGDEALRAVRAGLAVRAQTGHTTRLLAATVHVELRGGPRLDSADLDRALDSLAKLPPGELFLDAPTRQLVQDRVELKRVGTHDAALSLSSAPTSRRKILGVQTPTVGREAELATLRATFQKAVETGEPEAAVVVGPAGIGKSRLHDELLPELRQRCALCLEAHAEPARARTPYSLMADAVTRGAGLTAGTESPSRRAGLEAFIRSFAPEQTGRETLTFIGDAVGVPFDETPSLRLAREDPRVMRERVTLAFETFLRAAAEQGPACLILEDLQWADEESLTLLEVLLERLEGSPLFVMATGRPELLERRPDLFSFVEPARIEVRTLGRRSLRRLLRSMLGRDLSPALEEVVARWSDGNPYFAEEIVAWMVAEQAIVVGEHGWEVRRDLSALLLPVGIEGAIQGRLDHLGAELKDVLKAVSVFGDVFWESGCEALGFSGAAQKLRTLEGTDFIATTPDSRIAGTSEWRFRNALVRQVAYGMLPADVRKTLHRSAACWLESAGETDAALLARHFEQAGELDRAADQYARAATRALAEGNAERAVEWYGVSLHEGLGPRQRADRGLGLARGLLLLGRYQEAWQAIEPLAAGEGEPDRRGYEVLLLEGRILRGRRMNAEAEALMTKALAGLDEKVYPELRFEMMHTLFWAIWVQGRYKDAGAVAQSLFVEAIADGRPERLGLAKLAMSYFNVVKGDLSVAIDLATEAAEHAKEIGHPYREVDALLLLGSTRELAGLYAGALTSLEAARTLARRLKTAFHQASIENCLGRVTVALGDTPVALEHFQAAVEIATRLGDKRTLAVALAGKASGLCQRAEGDDFDRAGETGLQALELARGQAPAPELEARLVLARIALARGATDGAVDHALAALELLDRIGTDEQYEIQVLLAAHDALVAADRTDEAREVLGRAARVLRSRARRIGDASVRESYCRAPHNARVTQLWEARRG